MNNIAIIGDIHGCAKSLKALLKKIPANYELYCVGDIIDRGPAIRKTVELVQENEIKCTIGNHEWLCLTGFDEEQPNFANWLKNGGKYTIGEFYDKNEFYSLISYIKTFPYYYDLGEYMICHAGINEGLTVDQSIQYIDSEDTGELLSSIVWNRGSIYLAGKFIICGHTPVKKEVITDDYCNIDTGCVYKNKLTAILLPGKEIVQVDFQE